MNLAEYKGVYVFAQQVDNQISSIALELIGKGVWKEAGVYSPEYFDPKPYLELMEESGYNYGIIEK